jgi:hypothetical protein
MLIFANMENNTNKFKGNTVNVLLKFPLNEYIQIKKLAASNNRSIKNYIENLVKLEVGKG